MHYFIMINNAAISIFCEMMGASSPSAKHVSIDKNTKPKEPESPPLIILLMVERTVGDAKENTQIYNIQSVFYTID